MKDAPSILWVGRRETHERFRRQFGKIQNIELQHVEIERVEEMKNSPMDMVMVESAGEHEQTCEILETVSAHYPDSFLLLHIPEKPSLERLIQYMNYGVRDVFTNDDNPEGFLRKALALLERKSNSHAEESAKSSGRVISFFSSKGGVGKTFLSVSSACLFSLDPKMSTILVDLNLQFGDIDLYLNANSMQTLGEAIEEARNNSDRLTDFILDNHIHQRLPNLHLLSAPLSPEKADIIGGADIGNLIKLLKKRYNWVILDTGQILNEITIAAFDKSDRIFLVVNDEIASVKNAGQTVQLLKKMNYAEDKVDFLVNRFNGRFPLDDEMLLKILGRKPYGRVPASEKVIDSINQGYVLAEKSPNDPAIVGIRDLIHKLAAEWNTPVPSHAAFPSLLGRFLPGRAA